MAGGVAVRLIHRGALVALLAVVAPIGAAELRLELLGQDLVPSDIGLGGCPVGGLSGLAWDAASGHWLAVSDDKGEYGPVRFYTLEVSLPGGRLSPGGVRVAAMTPVVSAAGERLPEGSLDLEAVAIAGDGTLLASSEGNGRSLTPPFIHRLSRDGRVVGSVELPEHFSPRPGMGVRHNLAFESLAVAPDGTLVAGLENALVQDGPEAGVAGAGPARLLLLPPAGGPVEEYLYPVDPAPPGGWSGNGLAELVALDRRRLLALERGFSTAAGNRVRLWEVRLDDATDVAAFPGVAELPVAPQPADKRLLLDFATLGVPVDNLEAMALGPVLADGRRLLLVASDDNFNHGSQVTQVLAFAVGGLEPPAVFAAVHDIQGKGHLSPLAGERVETRAVVTAAAPNGSLWVEADQPDDDLATSEGLLVRPAPGQAVPVAGDLVAVVGRVAELGDGDDLPLTALVGATVGVLASGHPLPPPAVLGEGGRQLPVAVYDDDGLASFEPLADGLDALESLEGMRVRLPSPAVVGPTGERGEAAVTPRRPGSPGLRSPRGGVVATEDSSDADRLVVRRLDGAPLPALAVGDRLDGALEGILGYESGSFRLLVTGAVPTVVAGDRGAETTALVSGPGALTVATFNVHNLSTVASAEEVAAVARVIAVNLAGPDLVAVQEIQDDSGPADDGVVSAAATLARLTEAVVAAGGPRYLWRQVDPVDNHDGGQPGGNIRVALLAREGRVRPVDRGRGGALDSTGVAADGSLTLSPGRVAPRHPAFAGDPAAGQEGGRKPLAVELEVDGERLVVVVCHLRSKRGDDREMGRFQPPRRSSEPQRRDQAEVVHGFVQEVLTAAPGRTVIVLGDLNELPGRPPIRALAGAELVDMVELVPAAERFTYVFDGLSQVLDHVLVSRPLAGRAEVDAVHCSAELPEAGRASDHDPLLVRLPWPP